MKNDWPVNEESKLRSIDEIQRAHDILVAVNLGEAQNPFGATPEAKDLMIIATDTLCWVLSHNHSKAFQNNLDAIIAVNGEPRERA